MKDGRIEQPQQNESSKHIPPSVISRHAGGSVGEGKFCHNVPPSKYGRVWRDVKVWQLWISKNIRKVKVVCHVQLKIEARHDKFSSNPFNLSQQNSKSKNLIIQLNSTRDFLVHEPCLRRILQRGRLVQFG